MKNEYDLKRFEELEAGRVLGDLDAGEMREWQELSRECGVGPDFSLELTTAAVETDFIRGREDEIPDDLLARIRQDIVNTPSAQSPPSSPADLRPSFRANILLSPPVAWAIAAVFALLFIAEVFIEKSKPNKPLVDIPDKSSVEQARRLLLEKAPDLVKTDFGGVGNYPQMSGQVVWSDARQEGYMTLTDLPANDPEKNQYQLWIVDPDRDEQPVDGGVFNIPSEKETAIIPIRNALMVSSPDAFVITLEQPGGVVVSEQKTVVALAKKS